MTRRIPVSSAPCLASATPSASAPSMDSGDAGQRPASQPSRAAHELHRTRSGDRGAPAARGRGPPADAHGRRRLRQDAPGAGSWPRACSIAFADGVWVVDLVAAVRSQPGHADGRLGARRPRGTEPADPATRSSDYVRNRQMLLVLDNCEHLIAACAQLADALLRAAARLCILATSREGLGITGETVWRVPSLSLPDPSQDAVRRDAAPARCREAVRRARRRRRSGVRDHRAPTPPWSPRCAIGSTASRSRSSWPRRA